MFGTASAAITSLKTALDMLKVAVDSRDFIKLAEIKINLTDQVLDVQTAFLELQEKNASLQQDKHSLANEKRELETELMGLREQIGKLAKYERFRTPSGTLVFVETESKDSPDGPVYACAACMDEGKISTLQPTGPGKQFFCYTHKTIPFEIQKPKMQTNQTSRSNYLSGRYR
ncbi:hypothetical protein [Alcaligenes endophyticus]|uniref:Uncharacterized protein n=1 Tax=Alcaligenes endophyticus TaxID=1929088 RepID=A0ABT8EKJ6_9BURK|nr:hypothetical protein [Alcaligenes endophyticus]MCX5590903.1 hypothetical protein [Alcaligenes endophyticus]MDN4121735.1 hypothetical protein [Alcaligenes endophyticus]